MDAHPAGLTGSVVGSRRTVTIVFADLVGSTELGDRLDPEVVRAILRRFYELARRTLESHGGSVEKFIGDAVMAVFGLPEVHEDDALRAAHAALALRAALADLDPELQLHHGLTLRVRIGVETGEVMAGDPIAGETLVTGDAVNLAARLQGAAAADEILIGPRACSLLRDVAQLELLEPRHFKGKAEPIAPERLVRLTGGSMRRVDGPFVGRDTELTRLRAAHARVVSDRRAGIVTIVAPPGTGKSRLVAELIRDLDACVLMGRCLSYGDGITYWPIAEIVRSAAGITEVDRPGSARAKLDELVAGIPEGRMIAGRVAAAIGLESDDGAAEETPWAVRRLFEVLAAHRTLVLVIDDLQWAEPALLDLLEYVVGWSEKLPILAICLGRPELRERRPDWALAIADSLTISLAPLAADATGELLDLLAGSPLPHAVREHISRTSDGNPLFAEQILAMLIDEGQLRPVAEGWELTTDLGSLAIPATVGALLSARLDRLRAPERAALERSSIVGERFEGAAVVALSSDAERPFVSGDLLALVRKELLRPDRTELFGGDSFRFRHLLVRDAAYRSLPKAERARLHELFATWLVRTSAERLPEVEAIVGHHYEQAHEYRAELAPADPEAARLADLAAEHLAHAGRRSLDSGDVASAAATLGRAFRLMDLADPRRLVLGGELVVAQALAGDSSEASTLAAGLTAQGDVLPELGRLRLLAQVVIARCFIEGTPLDPAPMERALERLAEIGDDLGLAWAWHALALCLWSHYQVARAETARDRAREHARRAGSRWIERLVLFWGASVLGSRPVEEAMVRSTQALLDAGDDQILRSAALTELAGLHAFVGDIDRARDHHAQVRTIFDERGLRLWSAGMVQIDALIEFASGDPARAVQPLRTQIRQLEMMGATSFRVSSLATLALAEASCGMATEAAATLDQCQNALEQEDVTDIWASATALQARGRLAAQAGRHAEAAALAGRSVDILRPTDLRFYLIETLTDLARARRDAGEPQGARAAAQEALELAIAKGYVVGAQRAQALLV